MDRKPGKFTQQFDVEILKKYFDQPGEDQEAKKIQEKLSYVEEKLEQRKNFLLERFPNSSAEESEEGLTLYFRPSEQFPRSGKLAFTFHWNRDTFALQLECTSQIGNGPEKKDYIMLSLKKFNPTKVDNFIEAKILQFARKYVQGDES